MEKLLLTALFFTGALLAACGRLAPAALPAALPAPAAEAAAPAETAPAGQAAAPDGGYYLAWDGEGAFWLRYVDPATRRDVPVAAASGTQQPDGSRAVRFERAGRTLLGRAGV